MAAFDPHGSSMFDWFVSRTQQSPITYAETYGQLASRGQFQGSFEDFLYQMGRHAEQYGAGSTYLPTGDFTGSSAAVTSGGVRSDGGGGSGVVTIPGGLLGTGMPSAPQTGGVTNLTMDPTKGTTTGGVTRIDPITGEPVGTSTGGAPPQQSKPVTTGLNPDGTPSGTGSGPTGTLLGGDRSKPTTPVEQVDPITQQPTNPTPPPDWYKPYISGTQPMPSRPNPSSIYNQLDQYLRPMQNVLRPGPDGYKGPEHPGLNPNPVLPNPTPQNPTPQPPPQANPLASFGFQRGPNGEINPLMLQQGMNPFQTPPQGGMPPQFQFGQMGLLNLPQFGFDPTRGQLSITPPTFSPPLVPNQPGSTPNPNQGTPNPTPPTGGYTPPGGGGGGYTGPVRGGTPTQPKSYGAGADWSSVLNPQLAMAYPGLLGFGNMNN